MSIHYSPMDAITMRAQTILAENGIHVNYHPIAEAIYDPWTAFANELSVGDTFELPTGLTVTVTFKPGARK